MGLRTKNGNQSFPTVAVDLQRARFGAFFPRVFACAHSLTGDETTAREVVIEAFSRTFAGPGDLTDDEFAILLFATTRDLCRAAQPSASVNDRLNSRERELLALVFDARLSRENIRRLMDTTEQALSSILLRALRKLQTGRKLPAAKPSLRPA
jgi:DNA-directed RNA polymerase specialized sigma24 family protein